LIDTHNKHGGRRPGAGRKRTPSHVMREAIDKDTQNLPSYFEKLSELALKGDKECLQYLIDRHLGKPKQQTDLELKGGKELGVGVVTRLMTILAQSRREFLEGQKQIEGGSDATE